MGRRPISSVPHSRLAGTLLALPFLLMGGFITGIGMEWFPYDPAKVHAPLWVIAIGGLLFVAGGCAVLSATYTRNEKVQQVFGLAILVGLAIISNWVAFGPGERRFTSSTSFNGAVTSSREVNDRTGRVVFGIGAVVLDFAIIAFMVNARRRR